jgi:Family of unknown function (DUF5320)
MPGRDGTGPMGYGPMTGGRRGYCAGANPYPGRGGGRGSRNQFCATGLTGGQRAVQADIAATPIGEAPEDPFARLEGKLAEVLERLQRLETAGQK